MTTEYIPREQLPITLFDGVVMAIRADDGAIYLVIRDLCLTLDLLLTRQLARMRNTTRLNIRVFRIREGNMVRTLDCLLLDDLPVWLMTLRPRTGSVAATRLSYVQSYLDASVRSAFAALTGLRDAPSRQIEDIQDLDQIGTALVGFADVAARQSELEASQDRAREVWRDMAAQIRALQETSNLVQALRERVQALEQAANAKLSPGQRNTLYRMVHAWGEARAAQRNEPKSGSSIRACWQLLNARFKVAAYTDLSAADYDAAMQFIQSQYQEITGERLETPEQGQLL